VRVAFEECGVDDGEDGDVCADAERQRGDDEARRHRSRAQRSKTGTEIRERSVHAAFQHAAAPSVNDATRARDRRRSAAPAADQTVNGFEDAFDGASWPAAS